MIEVKITGLNKLAKLANRYPAVSQKYVDKAIGTTLDLIRYTASQMAPMGVTGNLRAQWETNITPFSGRLRSSSPYAADVEFGTRPHFVSAEQLRPWADKKGLNPWAVSRSIAKKGTKANPFFQGSIDRVRPGINNIFKNAIDGTLKELTSLTE